MRHARGGIPCARAARDLERQLAARAAAPRARGPREAPPDALLMQETKADPGAFPHTELEAAGYRGGRPQRRPLGRRRRSPPAPSSTWPTCARASPASPTPARRAGSRRRWPASAWPASTCPTAAGRHRRVRRQARVPRGDGGAGGAARGRPPTMVAGDMNVCPTDADVYDPAAFVGSTHVTPQERERARPRCSRAGLVDAYRRARIPTTWASPGGTTARATSTAACGLRIDLRPGERRRSPLGCGRAGSTATSARARSRPTTRRSGRARRRRSASSPARGPTGRPSPRPPDLRVLRSARLGSRRVLAGHQPSPAVSPSRSAPWCPGRGHGVPTAVAQRVPRRAR